MNRRAQSSVRWIIAAAVLGAAALGIGFAVAWSRPEVIVTRVVEGPVVQAFYATGTVSSDREYSVRANVAGILVEMRVDKGQPVKKGQVLAMVASDDLNFKLRQTQAELAEKQQRADDQHSPVLAEYDAKIKAFGEMVDIGVKEELRLTKLMASSAGTQTDIDRATERARTAWSQCEGAKAQRACKKLELEKELQVARAAVEIAQFNADQQTVRSPIDGVVLDRPIAQGTRLAINDHILLVADVTPNDLVMRAAVDEEDKIKVQPKQTVRMMLYSFPGRPFRGTVEKVYDKADPDRRTFEVDVRLADPDPGLAPGMTGELAFIISSKERAPVIPSQALQSNAVWIVRDRRLVKSAARIGLQSVERVEVLSGLRADDEVVISPIGKLREGALVRTKSMDPAAAAGLNKEPEKDTFKGFN